MAQVKLLKIGSTGIATEMDTASDDITLASFSVQSGGPVLSGTGLDMNTQAITDSGNISFTNAASNTINGIIANNLMSKAAENVMALSGAILFPAITDDVDQVDSFRLPALAGDPTVTPADGGAGYAVFNSTNKRLLIWDGAAWVDTSLATEATVIDTLYTAGENLTAGDVVYISAANTISKAKADALTTATAIGFATDTVLSAAGVHCRSAGVITGLTGLTAGARQFLSPATAGAITETLPVGSGNVIIQVGYAKNTTDVQIQIQSLGRRA